VSRENSVTFAGDGLNEAGTAAQTRADAQGMNARPGNKKGPFPILWWLAILAVVGSVLLVLIIL
jgi:hypothetical protein